MLNYLGSRREICSMNSGDWSGWRQRPSIGGNSRPEYLRAWHASVPWI